MEKNLIDEIFDSFGTLFNNDFWETKVVSPYKPKYTSHQYDDETKTHSLFIEAVLFKKDDITIDANNKGLIIKGEIKDEKTKKIVNRTEFHYVLHNSDVDPDSVEATFDSGMLIIKFKTNTEKTSKKIAIK